VRPGGSDEGAFCAEIELHAASTKNRPRTHVSLFLHT
jgi:hypothetical protein